MNTNPKNEPLIGVVIPAYNHVKDVAACLEHLAASTYKNFCVVVVDNNSTDETAAYVMQQWPEVTLIELDHNRGYAGGVNRGWEELQERNVEYLMILTQDVLLSPDWALPLIAAFAADTHIAAAQPLLCYQDDRERINSAGNAINFLGFGYSWGDGLPVGGNEVRERIRDVTEVIYASGGALMLRASVIKKIGLFQDSFFMYHEDLDLGWRIRLAGFKNVLVPASRAYHRYEFHRSTMIKYEYGERNRLLVLLENYRLPTLFLIFPAWFIMEVAVVAFSLKNGWFKEKMRGSWYIIDKLPEILDVRKKHQALRVKKDRDIVRDFSGEILYQNDPTSLLFLANPFFRAYWSIVKKLIVW